MRYVIAYDVADDRRRAKVAKALEQVAERVQGSVFEADLNEAALTRLQTKLSKLIDGEADSVRLYRLCGECTRAVALMGLSRPTPAPDLLIV